MGQEGHEHRNDDYRQPRGGLISRSKWEPLTADDPPLGIQRVIFWSRLEERSAYIQIETVPDAQPSSACFERQQRNPGNRFRFLHYKKRSRRFRRRAGRSSVARARIETWMNLATVPAIPRNVRHNRMVSNKVRRGVVRPSPYLRDDKNQRGKGNGSPAGS